MSRILLVDDDVSVRAVIACALINDGHRLTLAMSGEEAIELIFSEKMQFDLVISDIKMPGLNGMELSARIREHFPEIAIILITGQMNNQWHYQQTDHLASAILEKPFTLVQLRLTLGNLLPEPDYASRKIA